MALLLFLVAACGSSSPPSINPDAQASGEITKPLAGGKLASLPTGPQYIRVVHFPQPSGYLFKSTQHVPGFVFVEHGTQRLLVDGQSPQDINAGEAFFLGSLTHHHLNLGPETNSWYFLALWPSSARSQPQVDPIAVVVFRTPDMEPAALPQGTYFQTLREVTLGRGGRSAAHRFGGSCVLFVLQGSLTLRAAGSQPVNVTAGQGASYPPGVGLQELNGGADAATFIELLTTLDGQQFETLLTQPPAA